MKQLETRFYAREELAAITKVNVNSSHFARDIKNKLEKWGYSYDNPSRKGMTITRAPETAEEKLKEILYRVYDIDTRIDTKDFACFVAAFLEVEGFEAMPWGERAAILRDGYNVSVDEKTLRSWCNKLIGSNTITKSDERVYWCTMIEPDGERMRYQVEGDEELEKEFARYKEMREKLIKDHITREISKGREDYKVIKAEAWSKANYDLWKYFNCCFYSCKTLMLSAFDDHNELEEVYELIKEIINDVE